MVAVLVADVDDEVVVVADVDDEVAAALVADNTAAAVIVLLMAQMTEASYLLV